MTSTIEKMLPFPLEKAPLLLLPQSHVMNSTMEADPKRKSLFQGHKMAFPLLCDPGLAVPALHAASSKLSSHILATLFSFSRQAEALGQCQITEPSVMCQRNECLPAEQSTHRSDGQTGMKRGPKLYSLPRRCLLRNQNKTLYQHSLLCHLWAKRMDGDTESQQCRSPGVAQSRCQHRLLGVVPYPILQVTDPTDPRAALPAPRVCWCQRTRAKGSELPAPGS